MGYTGHSSQTGGADMVLCSSEVCEKTVLDVLRACGVLQHLHCEDGARDRPIQPIVEDAESREQRECRECLWYGPTKPILTERPAARNARPTPCSRAAARHSAEGCGGFLHAHVRELCQRGELGRNGSRKSVATEICKLEQREDRERPRNRAGEVVSRQGQPRDPRCARETGKNVGDRADES